jgi:hypothetical protein
MRNDLRRRLVALAAATAAVALLSGNIAAAQPAAPAAAGAPLRPAVIGAAPAPGPNACPRLHGTSQGIPSTPNSCGPPPTTAPPPPPPIHCELSIGQVYRFIDFADRLRMAANAGIECTGGKPLTITLTVAIYEEGSPSYLTRHTFTVPIPSYGIHLQAESRCLNGRFYGWAKAEVYFGPRYIPNSMTYGPETSAVRTISCS